MNEIQISDEVKEKSASATDLAQTITQVKAETPQDYQHIAGTLREIRRRYKELDQHRKSITIKLDQAKRGIMDLFRNPLNALRAADTYCVAEMRRYDYLLEKAQAEEEARIRERQRKERERIERRARQAEEKGREEKAEALRMQSEQVPEISVNAEKPKVEGISYREEWRAEVTDKMALIKAVAEGKAPSALLDVNMKVVNQQARALKTELHYPGVRVFKRKTVASRG